MGFNIFKENKDYLATYSKSPPVAVNHHRDAQLWQRMKQGDEQALSLILMITYGYYTVTGISLPLTGKW